MKEFIEKILHQKIEISEFDNSGNLPLVLKGSFYLYSMDINGHSFLLAKPREEQKLAVLRKQQRKLEQLTGKYCILYITRMNYYARDKMLDEGIPFIWENRQIYMPFFGILLQQNDVRELKPCANVSFLTQKLLLTALYEKWQDVTVTVAADLLNVSKMSITRCFDEIESLDIPVLSKKGRTRLFVGNHDKKEMWEIIKPYLKNPLIKEYRLRENISKNLIKSGFSALSEYSLLEDNIYPTYAITKSQLSEMRMNERKLILKGEEPGCIIQELGYVINFNHGTAVDPLTTFMLLYEEMDDPRVEIALEKMLEDYVW